jgi:hypothetical protein
LTTVSNGLALGRVDWAGNFREGLKVSFMNSEAYNAQWHDLMSDLEVEVQLFSQRDQSVGVTARLLGLGRLSGDFPHDRLTMLGQHLRGIIDSRASGVQAAFLNLGLGTKLFDFPTHAIIKTRALDFELQAQPFLDLAIVRPDYSSSFSQNWFWCSGGLELLVFPAHLRSFTLRASAGWDLKNALETRSLTAKAAGNFSPYELFLGSSLLF